MSIIYPIALVFHIIGVVIAVGSATIVDYLHLVGLRRANLEKGLVRIYPHISRLINISLVIIYLSGIALLIQKPELITSPLFLTKLILVIIVTVNGFYLQRAVSPQLDKCVIKGNKYCTTNVLYSSAISGSISIVTWYSILILSLTKNLGYTLTHFILAYVIVLALAITTSFSIERKARKWRG
jgi:hypothetical protein